MNSAILAAIAAVWLILFVAGDLCFRLASLDPHNPAALPGRWSRAGWSLLAGTSLIIALPLQGDPALFFASLAIGTVLSPGLNDSFQYRRDEKKLVSPRSN